MRKLLLGAAAISLSGCSFLGIGGHGKQYSAGPAYGGHYAAAPKSRCGVTTIKKRPASTGCLSRWNLEGGIGASFNVGGDIITGDEAVNPAANVRNVEFDEAYETGRRAELGLSYALAPDTKVTAMGFIDEADSAGELNFGTVGGQAFTGALSDYRSTGVELGLRKYFTPTSAPIVKSVRPYVEGRIGAAYQDSIFVENAQLDGAPVGTGTLALSESGWVPSASGLVGLETPLTRYSTIGLETGVRWTGGADAGSAFNAGPFEGLAEDGSRISVPLMLRGRYRF